MVAFTGRCLVHRAEIMQLHGAWDDALGGARGASARGGDARAAARAGQAHYRQGEVHRLRGDSRAPRTPTARRAAAAPSRSRASRCCASRRATRTRRRRDPPRAR